MEMPRGGGGFRGGGFGGGGFRGGGFRGGSGGFRAGRVRSSGRPFGRTGSRRTVSRAPRSSSTRYRRHGRHRRHYWGHYWRPWWRRPWHWYWWWGRPYRPWYYGPVYWTGGFALAIVILLLVLPLFALAVIPFPFTNASSDGTVTYRDTQTLNYNEYWYEKETMKSGHSIEYSMHAQSPVTFLIWNQPFEDFPRNKRITGNYSEAGMTVEGNHDYQYIGYFLQTDSTLTYDFNVTGGFIEFFIADAQELTRWNNWEKIDPTVHYSSTTGESGSFSIPRPQDWYLVWYNSGSASVSVDFSIFYEAVGAFDFDDAAVKHEAVEDVDIATFEVTSDGDYWYFFIYFDPFVNPAISVDITFDVSYKTEVTHDDKWLDFQPILLVIGAIIVILLLIAIVQRRSAKHATTAAATTTTTPSGEIVTTPSTTTVPSVTKEGKCHRCQFTYKTRDVYCQNCGAKLVGRDYGVSKVSTPASAKNCASCGAALKPGSRYCKNCGAKIKQVKSYEYFPDERKSFFCQLDNEKHPSTDSAYKCVQCSRMVCSDCYDNISKTGLILCPYCKGDLVKAQ